MFSVLKLFVIELVKSIGMYFIKTKAKDIVTLLMAIQSGEYKNMGFTLYNYLKYVNKKTLSEAKIEKVLEVMHLAGYVSKHSRGNGACYYKVMEKGRLYLHENYKGI